jgi:hypothetical protein
MGYGKLRLLSADQQEVFYPPACSVLPPHCTKDAYTQQGSTRDLWTVCLTRFVQPVHYRGVITFWEHWN